MMEKENMQSLKELMDAELRLINISNEFLSLESFISDGKACIKFIKEILNDAEYELPEQKSDLYNIAEMRARHSVVTFLMGLVFKRFGGIFDTISSVINITDKPKTAQYMWLITSLYHDVAYSSKHIKDSQLDYHSKFDPYLLEDTYRNNLESLNDFSIYYPKTLAYTYEEIVVYDKYARKYHNQKGDSERIDHGILGGIITFERLTQKAIKQNMNKELTIIKACSLTISQHNIYKSASEEDDVKYMEYPELYKLYYNSAFRIDSNTPLLLFLCLVDTLECVKKFSREHNSSKYLHTLTVLDSIKLNVCENIIKIDLSELRKRVEDKKDKQLNGDYISYLNNGLLKLQEWTSFFSMTIDCKDYVEIKLN